MLFKNTHYIIPSLLSVVIVVIIVIFVPVEKMTRLEEILLTYNLDSGWSPGYNVNCETGKGTPNKSTTVKTSHCSCFIYAVCKELGLYIPSPPEYKQFHLADRQLDWISSENGMRNGWVDIGKSVPDNYIAAQKKANDGYIVIAGVTQDDRVNGHIGIVRPYRNVDFGIISSRGPIIIASSSPNTIASYLDDEFKLDQRDFGHLNGRVRFFYNKNTPQ